MSSKLDFQGLEEALLDLAGYDLPPAGADGIFDRLCQVLRQSQRAGRLVAPDDTAVLIRHVLRREARQGSGFASLRVPTTSGWPGAAHWARYGVRLHSDRDGFGVIDAQAWEPDWLLESDRPVFEDVFAEVNVRQDWQRPIDPFLGEASGFTEYVSPGQREAVRSALLLPPGETLIVGLPTGSGKSLVAQAPVLVRGLEGGLTLCIIPTTPCAGSSAADGTAIKSAVSWSAFTHARMAFRTHCRSPRRDQISHPGGPTRCPLLFAGSCGRSTSSRPL